MSDMLIVPQDAIDEAILEQYKMLRTEVIDLVKETRSLEVLVVGAIAALFAWLVTQRKTDLRLWFLAPVLALFGGLRALGLYVRIGDIAGYMKTIELQSAVPNLPGWETYFEKNNTFALSWITFPFWILLIIGGIAAPFLLRDDGADPEKVLKVELIKKR